MDHPTTPRNFLVAGVQHRPTWELERDRFSRVVDPATLQVKLLGEPSNTYDRYAVKVLINGVHIGYVPKAFSADFWGLHALGYQAVAALVNFSPSAQPWQMYEIAVTFKK